MIPGEGIRTGHRQGNTSALLDVCMMRRGEMPYRDLFASSEPGGPLGEYEHGELVEESFHV
jgi:hypothetical protein